MEAGKPSELYNQLYAQGAVTKRQFAYVYILGADNKPWHENPIRLSLAGASRGSFSDEYDNFRREMAQAYAKASNTQYRQWPQRWYALGVFEPTLFTELTGPEAGKQSHVTKVQDFVHPTPENLTSWFLGLDPKQEARIQAVYDLIESGSATEKLLQNHPYHALALDAGSQYQLNPASVDSTPAINPEVDEDGLPLLKSAAPVE
jgi:hypothetical protein